MDIKFTRVNQMMKKKKKKTTAPTVNNFHQEGDPCTNDPAKFRVFLLPFPLYTGQFKLGAYSLVCDIITLSPFSLITSLLHLASSDRGRPSLPLDRVEWNQRWWYLLVIIWISFSYFPLQFIEGLHCSGAHGGWSASSTFHKNDFTVVDHYHYLWQWYV